MSGFAGTLARKTWGQGIAAADNQTAAIPTPSGALTNYADTNLFASGLQDGMTQADNGDGTFNIMQGDKNLGVGYKDVFSAIGDLSYKNADAQTTNTDGVWSNPYLLSARQAWVDSAGVEIGEDDAAAIKRSERPVGDGESSGDNGMLRQKDIWEPAKYSSKDELAPALKGAVAPKGGYGGTMGQWEALGQVINGGVAPGEKEWGGLPSNGQVENITGKNTLFGSTPQFKRNEDGSYELAGYRIDTTPNAQASFSNGGTDNTKQEGYGTFTSHNGKNHSWNNSVWRELNNPEAWGRAAVMGKDGAAFIPKEATETIPGWSNKDAYQHKDIKHGIVQKIWEATSAESVIYKQKYEDGSPYAEVIGNIVGMYFTGYPLGSLVMGADNVSKGDEKAAMSNLINGVASVAAAEIMSGTSADPFAAAGAAAPSLGQIAAAGAVQAGSAAAGTYIATGDTQKAYRAALGGILQAGISMGANSFLTGDTGKAMTLEQLTGWTSGVKGLDPLIMKAGIGAVKAAASAGVKGDDLADVFTKAGSAAVSTLVGGAVGSETGSNLAGTVAGSVTSGLIGQATKPDAPSGGGTNTPAPTSKPVATNNTFAGTLARKSWGNT